MTKRIKDLIDGVYDKDEAHRERKAAQEQASYENMSEKTLAKELKRIEKAMHDAAKNLEFEKAAQFRDQFKKLKLQVLGAEVEDLK